MSDGEHDDTSSNNPPPDATSVYGVVRAGNDEADQTSAYGAATPPQWSAPGEASSPQATSVQPQYSQPQYSQPQYVPQPTPGSPPTQAYPQVGGPAPAAPPPSTAQTPPPAQPGYGAPQSSAGTYSALGPKRWNLWAGVPAAVSVAAIGTVWRLGKVVGDVVDFPFRQQLAVALDVGFLVLGVLTLLALGGWCLSG